MTHNRMLFSHLRTLSPARHADLHLNADPLASIETSLFNALDDLRVLLIAQPMIVVDDSLTMAKLLVLDAFGDGWLGHPGRTDRPTWRGSGVGPWPVHHGAGGPGCQQPHRGHASRGRSGAAGAGGRLACGWHAMGHGANDLA